MTQVPATATDHPPPDRRRLVRLSGFAVSVLVVVLAAVLVPMPLIESAPGGTTAIAPLLEVDADTTPLSGDLELLTVRISAPSLAEVVRATIDDHRDLRRRDAVIPPDLDTAAYFALQREAFRRTFRVAAAVGLRAAGHDISIGTSAQVAGLLAGGPADGVLEVGDVIRRFAGQPVSTTQEIVDLARDAALGDRLDLQVERDGTLLDVSVIAGRVPGLEHPGMGITLQAVAGDIDLPFDVTLTDQHGIGGPSAGLMIALTVYDLVADEDLLAGRHVVGTGAVDGTGMVGPIGSIREKAFTAVAAGADVMLVPAPQAAEARAAAAGRIEVVGVATVDEAIAALRR